MENCKMCGRPHDGNYGKGFFCSQTCAKRYSNAHGQKNRNSQVEVLNFYNRVNTAMIPKRYISENEIISIRKSVVIAEFLKLGYYPLESNVENDSVDIVVPFAGRYQKIRIIVSVTGNNEHTEFLLLDSCDDVDYVCLYDYNFNEVYMIKPVSYVSVIIYHRIPSVGVDEGIRMDHDYRLEKVLRMAECGISNPDDPYYIEPMIFMN